MKRFFNHRLISGITGPVLLLLLVSFGVFTFDAYGGHNIQQLVGFFSGSKDAYEAPEFELPDIEGGSVSLAQYRGKRPVLLYFWATWCPSCRAVKPDLIKLRERTKEEELEILAINVGSGDSLDKLKRYQKKHPLPAIKVLYDNNGRVTQHYSVQGIPLFVLVDIDGKVTYRDHQLPVDFHKYLASNQ